MFNINKPLPDPDLLARAPQSNPYDLDHWSREIAQAMAHREGLGDLSERQWQVLDRLRSQFRRNGRAESVRVLMQAIEQEFTDEGGRGYLYRLFPQGPITQGCRLAGIPPPPYSVGPAFSWFG